MPTKSKKPSMPKEVVLDAAHLDAEMSRWAQRHPNYELTAPVKLVRFIVRRKPGTCHIARPRLW